MSARDYVESLPSWERRELARAANAFEEGRDTGSFLLEEWQLTANEGANFICGWCVPPGQGSRLVALAVVGADPGRGRIFTVVGWLTLGTGVDPVEVPRGVLERFEADAQILRNALLNP
ncbi:hypothetical protein [Rubellimicrobium roseum]|uniref:Uncharacterized protein n=1 Tax=Rubellimicrobium roseum TaxID=687525 RepID=A0A5C4NA10_9RHOB|nr:hypothetical protein [Rubellimicrobium roseum]TNC59306.1 hypothetical protein FHG71_22965 [Rubellimicrobium roseum]